MAPNTRKVVPISGHTNAAGSGTEHRIAVDSNGMLRIVIFSGAVTIDGSVNVVGTLTTTASFNVEADDDTIPAGETRETQNNLLYGYDGTQWERLVTDTSGRLKVEISDGGGSITVDGTVAISGTVPVSGTLTTTASFNAETDDDLIPAGESRETQNNLLYGFDGTNWERVRTDGSGKLLVTTP